MRGLPLRASILAIAMLGALALPAAAQAQHNVYVSNFDSSNISVYDVAQSGALGNITGSPFSTGTQPTALAITPDATRLYSASFGTQTIAAHAIGAGGTLSTIPGPFLDGTGPLGMAITPDGQHLYVADNATAEVRGYTIAGNGALPAVAGSPFTTGTNPRGLAISPDGQNLYVPNMNNTPGTISAFSIAANGALTPIPGSPIPAGAFPNTLTFTPDGTRLYASNTIADQITAFSVASDGSLSTVLGSPFAAGDGPSGITVNPAGTRLFATNDGGNAITVLNIAASGALSPVAGSPFNVGPSGTNPIALVVNPAGTRLFVANQNGDNVSSFTISASGALGSVLGSPVTSPGGHESGSIAITPDQPPVAAFSTTSPQPRTIAFDGGASTDADGTIAKFDWNFGDGQTLPDGGPTPNHEYAADGSYTASLTLTDEEGCSTTQVFTGQTASCNGGPQAVVTRQVTVDTKLDGLTVKAKKTQKQKGKKVVVVVDAGAAEAVEAVASGKLKAGGKSFALKDAKANVDAGRTASLKLKPKKSKDSKKILKAIAAGKKTTASIAVTATDSFGNEATSNAKVKLK